MSGKDPHGTPVTSSPASATTPIAQTAALQLTKTASTTDVNGDFKIDLGDKVIWHLQVKNTGTTTLGSLAVYRPGGRAVTCPGGAAGARARSATCTVASHTVTQADVDAGVVSNTATASATDPQSRPVTVQPVHGRRAGRPVAPGCS